jgi:hypothetical protein
LGGTRPTGPIGWLRLCVSVPLHVRHSILSILYVTRYMSECYTCNIAFSIVSVMLQLGSTMTMTCRAYLYFKDEETTAVFLSNEIPPHTAILRFFVSTAHFNEGIGIAVKFIEINNKVRCFINLCNDFSVLNAYEYNHNSPAFFTSVFPYADKYPSEGVCLLQSPGNITRSYTPPNTLPANHRLSLCSCGRTTSMVDVRCLVCTQKEE